MQLTVIKSDSNDNFINSLPLMEQYFVNLQDWEDLREYYESSNNSLFERQLRIDNVIKFQ